MADKNKAAAEAEEQETGELIDPPAIDSKYRMIILAAQRSKQLQRGALSRTDIDTRKSKATRVAMRELKERRINFDLLDADGNKEEPEASQ